MIKKIVIVLIIISNIFILSGCWNSVEIDKMQIVAGIAIDKGKDDKKYIITAEIVNLKGNQNGDISSKTVESSGNTIFETIRNMISITSEKLYFGHCKTFIISEQLAQEGIIPMLDVFLRDHELRLTIDVLISKDVDAKEILLLKSETPSINSYDIDSMLDNSNLSLSKSTKSQVYELINTLSTKGISATLPAISIEKINNQDMFKLNGIAVFNKDKLVGFLNNEESKYFLFIVNKIKSPVLSVQINNKENSYICSEIIQNKTTVKYNFENDELSININTKTTASIDDIETYTNYADILRYQALETTFENHLENKIKSLIYKTQRDFGCDIFGFGKMLHEQDLKSWEKYELTWNETFQKLKVNVNSKFTFRNSGTIKNTIGIGD